MTTPTVLTTPDRVVQTSREDIVWGVNVSKQLTGGQTPTNATATLTGPAGPVSLEDTAVVNGSTIEQRIRVGTLTRGDYRLSVRHTPSGTTNILESVLRIVCP